MNKKRRCLTQILMAIGMAVLFNMMSGHVLAFAKQNKKNKAKPVTGKWNFNRVITIANSGEKVSDAVILIQLNNNEFDYTKTKTNGADIRFFATPGKLSGAGLSYWIEQWNDSGVSRLWVKVPVLKSNSQKKIYMVYGNSGAESVSNGNTTFLFFDDFEDGNYSKKWNNVSIGEVAEQGGMLKLKEIDGQDGIITANFDVTGKMIIRTSYQRERGDEHWTRAGIGGWNNWLCFGDHTDFAGTGTNYVMLYDSASLSSLKMAPLTKVANGVITGKWRRAAYWYDGNMLKGMQDDVTVELPVAKASSKLSLRTLDNDSWDNFKYITVSSYLNPQPVVTIEQQENNE